MTEDEVRRIVRDEIARHEDERRAERQGMAASMHEALLEHRKTWLEAAEIDPSDGPTVRAVKQMLSQGLE